MGTLQDLTGMRFGRLLVVCRAENIGKATAWNCVCDCGKEKVISGSSLRSGESRSCGCLRKELLSSYAKQASKTHGLSKTRIYRIWHGMKKRCGTVKHYESISVCDEWKDFIPFYEWAMGNGYSDNLTIDRIDGSKGYSPENCRWATQKVQQNNKSNNVFVEINGERRVLSEWSDISGIPLETLRNRLRLGWGPDILLSITDGHTPKWKLNGGESPLCKKIDIEKAVEMQESGMKVKEICNYFGISQSALYERIKRYKNPRWRRKN